MPPLPIHVPYYCLHSELIKMLPPDVQNDAHFKESLTEEINAFKKSKFYEYDETPSTAREQLKMFSDTEYLFPLYVQRSSIFCTHCKIDSPVFQELYTALNACTSQVSRRCCVTLALLLFSFTFRIYFVYLYLFCRYFGKRNMITFLLSSNLRDLLLVVTF